MPLIETERLLLRQWRPGDKNTFADLNADPEVMRHFPDTLSRRESDSMVDRMSSELAAQGWGLWATEVVSFTTEANTNSRRVIDKIGLHHDPARDFDHPTLPTWSGRRHVLDAIDRSAWMRTTLRPD